MHNRERARPLSSAPANRRKDARLAVPARAPFDQTGETDNGTYPASDT